VRLRAPEVGLLALSGWVLPLFSIGTVWLAGCESFGMNMLTRCLNFLDQSGVHYAHSIRNRPQGLTHHLAQTVVYWGNRGFGVLVLRQDSVVDFREVRRLMDLTEVRLATKSELESLFPHCEASAIPPLGNLDLPVLMDESIAVQPFLAFNAGSQRDVIYLSVMDYHNLVNPLVASFGLKKTEPLPIWGCGSPVSQPLSAVL
jgi:prolyl-tRNA editing enzyme YbaK/EbsC (Cys-tRNA(Pro) deacylase)